MIENRLLKNYQRLKKFINSENWQAYRLYDRDMPEYPYLIDRYGDYFIIYEKGKADISEIQRAQNIEEIKNALKKSFNAHDDKIIFKVRNSGVGGEKYGVINRKSEFIQIQEGQAKFYINLHDYVDVGLFLDHRPLRKWLSKNAKNKTLLNLFSYTCSVGLQFAMGGGESTNVDLSTTYLDWGEDNYRLNMNDITSHRFIKDDVYSFLRDDPHLYDFIFLDPPTFSNSKSMEKSSFDVSRDHVELIDMVMKHLKKDGVLFFSTNKRKFKLDNQVSQQYDVKAVNFHHIPPDFHDQNIHYLTQIIWK